MNILKKIFSGKRVLALTLVLTYAGGLACGVYASGYVWQSQGNIEYKTADGTQVVAFDKSDLDYLDGRIDQEIANVSSGKELIADSLLPLGTNSGSSLSGFSTFEDLANAVSNSQSIPSQTIGSSVSVPDDRYVLASTVTGSTIDSNTTITAATADNLSLGASAWVDGQLVVGTGTDNNNYYNKAYTQGIADGLSKVNVNYVYHQHVDGNGSVITSSTISTKGGCFTTSTPIQETIQVSRSKVAYDPGCNQDNSWGYCSRCGEIYTGWKRPGESWSSSTVSHTHTIGYAYAPGCGKTTSTIESAVISY